MSTLPQHCFTPDEYLVLERAAEYKSEYWDGQIWAMSGGILPHSLLASNLIGCFLRELVGGRCRVVGSDMRVAVPSFRQYFYPDVSVYCGDPKLQDDARDTLLNPVLIAEILSPSSEAYDRGRKWDKYQTIPSLQYYVLLAQDRPHFNLFTRRDKDNWSFTTATGLDSVMVLDKLGCTLRLSEIYNGIPFTDPDPSL